jgi:glycosyltransferase involved in cell wall biosynthesis
MANLPHASEWVLVSPTNGDLLPALREHRVPVAHIPLFRMRGWLGRPVGRLIAIAKLTSLIVHRRRWLTAIHANGFSELHLVALGAVLARVPVVAWFHAYEAEPWDRRLGPVWGRLLPKLRLIAVSELARQIVTETGLGQSRAISIVPNPIDPSEIRPEAESPNALATLGGPRPPVVGYLGSWSRDKGFDLLPDIVREVRDVAVEWAMFLPKPRSSNRDGKAVWSRLEALSIGRRVSFPGRMSDVRDAYRACDIVICPSRRESFGRIAAEAMVNGLPVVASDIGPFRELVGEAGLLFPTGDTAAAAAAVRRLVEEPSLRERLGLRGVERAASFGPGPIARRFSELYGLTGGST